MPPFWASIGILSAVQAAIVVLPGDGAKLALGRAALPSWLRSRWWALLPGGSIAGFVVVGTVAPADSADALTYVALCGVPVGAAVALGWLARGSRRVAALAVVPLFALAWVDRQGLAGEAAAVALSGLSCVALGSLLAAVTPGRWLAAGIVAMAVVDAAFVGSELLQHPNEILNAAAPAAGLPRLQAAEFGSAAMGYGDLFVAGLLGGLLATVGSEGQSSASGGAAQVYGALLVLLIALAFDLLFFLVNELPATVPVALALLGLVAMRKIGYRSRTLTSHPDRSLGRERRGVAGLDT